MTVGVTDEKIACHVFCYRTEMHRNTDVEIQGGEKMERTGSRIVQILITVCVAVMMLMVFAPMKAYASGQTGAFTVTGGDVRQGLLV